MEANEYEMLSIGEALADASTGLLIKRQARGERVDSAEELP